MYYFIAIVINFNFSFDFIFFFPYLFRLDVCTNCSACSFIWTLHNIKSFIICLSFIKKINIEYEYSLNTRRGGHQEYSPWAVRCVMILDIGVKWPIRNIFQTTWYFEQLYDLIAFFYAFKVPVQHTRFDKSRMRTLVNK